MTKRISRHVSLVGLLLAIIGCSVVAEYPVYVAKEIITTREAEQPSLYITEGARPYWKRSYGSHMFATDDVCVLVYETNISTYRTLFWGPFGCPCFPILFFNDLPERPERFHLAVAFVTRHKEHDFAFDPRKITLRHPNGTVSTPLSTIGGRAHMKWEESCPLLRPCRAVERIVDGEGFVKVDASYELWDWTVFAAEFPRQQQTLFPIRVGLEGMSRLGGIYNFQEFDLIEGRGRIAYVYPFRTPKQQTTWISPEACRLFWEEKPSSSDATRTDSLSSTIR